MPKRYHPEKHSDEGSAVAPDEITADQESDCLPTANHPTGILLMKAGPEHGSAVQDTIEVQLHLRGALFSANCFHRIDPRCLVCRYE